MTEKHVRLCILILVALAATLDAATVSAQPGKDQFEMPDLYLRDPHQRTCMMKTSIAAVESSKREALLTGFVKEAYEKSHRWEKDFGVSGMDYVNYSGFYVVLYGSCKLASQVTGLLKRAFGDKWTWSRNENKSLVSSEAVLKGARAPSLFRRFRPQTDIQSCLVSADARPTPDYMKYSQLFGLMYVTWKSYGLPFLYVSYRNRSFYVLFSRNCDHRREIMAEYLRLMSRSNPQLPKLLGPLDFEHGARVFISDFG